MKKIIDFILKECVDIVICNLFYFVILDISLKNINEYFWIVCYEVMCMLEDIICVVVSFLK